MKRPADARGLWGGGGPQLQLDTVVGDLVVAAGGCERLLGTPVPLSYTRHTSRCPGS